MSLSERKATMPPKPKVWQLDQTQFAVVRVAMAEPKVQCVPRQSHGTSGAGERRVGTGDQVREPHFLPNHEFRIFIFNKISPALTKSQLAGRYNEWLTVICCRENIKVFSWELPKSRTLGNQLHAFACKFGIQQWTTA